MAHQNLVFEHPTSPRRAPVSKVIVQHKARWGDAWTTLDSVRFDYATWSLAPSMPRAQITQRYGYGIQIGDSVFSTVAPLDLERHFLRIELQYEDSGGTDQTGWVWYGQVEIIGDQHDGAVNNTIKMGEQAIVALGLYNLLDQHRITTSWFLDDGGTERQANAGFTFNLDGKGNRSEAIESPLYYRFKHDPNPNSKKWSTRKIVEYLIRSKVGVPLDETGASQITWWVKPEDLEFLPNWDEPEIETHLVTTTQILNALINRRRLLSWWLEVDEATQEVNLRIKTFTSSAVSLPDGDEVPANPDTLAFNWENEATTSAVVQTDTSHKVDQVVAYGARRTNTCTLTFGVSSSHAFQKGWDATQEAAYIAAGSSDAGYPAAAEVKDRRRWHAVYRAKESVKPVYRRWALKPSFAYPPSDPDSYQMFFGNVMLLPTIPLLDGVDYSGNVINSGSYVYNGAGQLVARHPLVVIQVPGSSPARYVKLDEVGRSAEEITNEEKADDWSASIRIPRDSKTLTVDINGAPQHTIAFADFTPKTEDEQVHGEWDWNTMQATVSIADERFAEGRWPDDASVLATDAKRVIRIPAGDSHKLDWVKGSTVVDLNYDGSLLSTLTAGYIKDDRLLLENIAKSAYQWYGTTRRAVRMSTTWDDPCHLIELGQLVLTVVHKDLVDTYVGSVVSELTVEAYHHVGSEIRTDIPNMKMTLSTAFGELDHVQLRAGRQKISNHARRNR